MFRVVGRRVYTPPINMTKLLKKRACMAGGGQCIEDSGLENTHTQIVECFRCYIHRYPSGTVFYKYLL